MLCSGCRVQHGVLSFPACSDHLPASPPRLQPAAGENQGEIVIKGTADGVWRLLVPALSLAPACHQEREDRHQYERPFPFPALSGPSHSWDLEFHKPRTRYRWLILAAGPCGTHGSPPHPLLPPPHPHLCSPSLSPPVFTVTQASCCACDQRPHLGSDQPAV